MAQTAWTVYVNCRITELRREVDSHKPYLPETNHVDAKSITQPSVDKFSLKNHSI